MPRWETLRHGNKNTSSTGPTVQEYVRMQKMQHKAQGRLQKSHREKSQMPKMQLQGIQTGKKEVRRHGFSFL